MKHIPRSFLFAFATLCLTAAAAPSVRQAGNFALVERGELRVSVNAHVVESIQLSGMLLCGPVFMQIKTARWQDIGTELQPLEEELEQAERSEGRVVLKSESVIGKKGEGRWKVNRTVTIGPKPTVRVDYSLETLEKTPNAAYLYVSARLRPADYAGARASVRAASRVSYEGGNKKESPAPDSGLFEGPLKQVAGVFSSPRTFALETEKLGKWSMAGTGFRTLGLSLWNWTYEAQWVANPTATHVAVVFEVGDGTVPREKPPVATQTDESSRREVEVLPARTRPAGRIDASQRQDVCLNGDWEFLPGGTDDLPAADAPWVRMHVPGLLRDSEYDLPEGGFEPPYGWRSFSRSGRMPASGWYRFQFKSPPGWDDDCRVALEFEGVAGISDFYLEGRHVAHSESRQIPVLIPLDCRKAPGSGPSCTVLVRARRDRLMKLVGIWKDVFLRSRPRVEVENVFVIPSVRKKTLTVRVWIRNTDAIPHAVTCSPSVWLNGKPVLEVPAVSAQAPPGETREVSTSRPWKDPVLWGFAPYGRPVLYACRTELRDDRRLLDARTDRFGFREFWTQGRDFILNGKPIFLKGDLFPPSPDVTRNRWLMTLYYLEERGANINFIRFHSYYDFPNDLWLETADELGMLVEPQSYLRRDTPDRFALLRREWESFVRRHWNHPSVVMWSSDNEACSQASGLAPDSVFHMLDEIQALIRRMDPTRPVESQGNVQLGVAAKLGLFHHLEVFDAHPYGSPLGFALKHLMVRYECPPDVPIHVGEMYAGVHDPFNWWTRPAEMLRRKEAITLSYDNCGRFYHDSILSVAKAGARGASLCAGMGNLFWGPTPEADFRLGPWHDLVKITDESFDKVVHGDGKIVGRTVNSVFVRVKWPSRSGRGARPDLDPAFVHSGYGYNLNFWDVHRPPCVKNLAFYQVRKAFHQVDGQDAGPLADHRAPEVIATVQVDGKPREGVYVFARSEHPPWDAPRGVMTDRNGAAWIAVPEPGEYQFSAVVDGKRLAREVRLQAPPLDDRPGYPYLVWIDLGEPVSQRLQATLKVPTRVVIRDRVEQRVPGPEEVAPPEIGPGPYAPDKEGFLRAFLVCGPFPNVGDREKGYQGLDTDWLASKHGEAALEPVSGLTQAVSFPKGGNWRNGEAKVRWFGSSSDRAFFSLDRLMLPSVGIGISPPQDVVGYAACTLLSSRAEKLTLALGSDDGHKVWLNGKLVGRYPQHGAAKRDAQTYPVRLKRGENRLLVKVDQSFGDYGFYCRFLRGKTPVNDLVCFLVPHPIRSGPRRLTAKGGEQPCFSPDAERVAFTLFGNGAPQVCVLDVAGKTGVGDTVVEPLCEGFDPTWSPRGAILVYCRRRNGATNLWQRDPKTRREKALTRLVGQCLSPAFEPEGRRVVFVFRSDQDRGLRRLDLDSGKISVLSHGDERDPAPSPDGKRLAFVAASGADASCLFVLHLGAGKRRQLTQGGGNQGGTSAPTWSPDGRWIAYCQTSIQPYRNVRIVAAEGGESRPLTRDGKDNTEPCWAPDGKRLVLVSRRDTDNRNLWLAPFH